MGWRQNPSLGTLLQWGVCRKEHDIHFVRRELEYQIQVQTSRYSFESIIVWRESLNGPMVSFRQSLLWGLAKERPHLQTWDGIF